MVSRSCFAITVLIALFAFAMPAAAELSDDDVEFGLQLNGVSYHDNASCGREACNERNDGFGFELSLAYDWPVHIAWGAFDNSVHKNTWYAGAAKSYRIGRKHSYAIELGAFAGAIYYPVRNEDVGQWYPLLMPVIVMDLKHMRLNLSYMPSVHDEVSAAYFVQAVVPILRPQWFDLQ